MQKKKLTYLLLLLFLGASLFLTLNRHSRSTPGNYHCEIWADKAGYYVYLPATFIYGFDGRTMPRNIETKTGNGFSIDSASGVIRTKYTYGVSLMQLPFFLVAHALAIVLNLEASGFSTIYLRMVDVAAVFYSFFALIILFFVLKRYVDKRSSLICIACLYLGTNVFYFSIFETGMSHAYSFFLFSLFLYLSPMLLQDTARAINYLLFGLVVGLIITVRPMNVIFLPVFFIFNKVSWSLITKRYKAILMTAAAVVLIIIPQLIFWKYSYGHYLFYSYEGEGFTNILNPKVLELWFSTNNGLFIFNPIVILILAGLFVMSSTHKTRALLLGIYFLFLSYLFASWHDWRYGCSYGCRPFTEYFALFAIPVSVFVQRLFPLKGLKILLFVIMAIIIIYNIKMMFSYDGCWYGQTWDWKELWRLLLSNTK